MPNITVITDNNDNVLGTVRSGPVETEQGMLQFRAPVSDKHVFHEVNVTDQLLSSAPDQLHAEVAKLIRRS